MTALEHAGVSLFWWTCQASFAASLLFLAVRLTQKTFGRALGVSGCYALSLLVLARLFMPTPFPSRFSVMNALSVSRQEIQSSKTEIRVKSDVQKPIFEPAQFTAALPVREKAQVRSTFRGEPLRARMARPVTIVSWVWLLGVVGFAARVGLRQRRFRQWVFRQETAGNSRVEQLLEDARSTMAVHQSLRLIVMNDLATPALMGWRRPCLLLPRSVVELLDDRQLSMVFMHELAHVKRRDVLLNWIMIGAQSVHWFNPVIWAALRRLRADRELVCDAMVLQRLEKEDHRLYGGTLLKLLELFSRPVPCPTLLSALNGKSENQKEN